MTLSCFSSLRRELPCLKFSVPRPVFAVIVLLNVYCRANYRDWQTPGCVINKPELTILQFSDTHVRHLEDADWLQAELRKAIAKYKPDLIVHSGDVTLDGSISEWQSYTQGINNINPPPVHVWGNHDMPLKQTGFAQGGLSHSYDYGNYRLILVDTAWPGPMTGSYTSIPVSEFAALKSMAATQKKILIFAHHPLGKDAPHFRLRNADAVLALFGSSEILGVFTGHFHGAYLAPEGKILFAGVAPLNTHQRNHTCSQKKGYRIIEVQNSCLRTHHEFVGQGESPAPGAPANK